MSELQNAFDKYDKTGSAYGNVGLFVEAARKWGAYQVKLKETQDWLDKAGITVEVQVIAEDE